MSALLQFEDFAAPRMKPAQIFSAEDLSLEYQRGLSDGGAQARDAAMDQLTDLLACALQNASDEAATRRRAISETLAAVTPILQAVASQLAAVPCDRLTNHLSFELERLCLAGIAPTCRISGGVELIERLGNRIEALGLRGVTLLPGPRTEITFDGGKIAVEPDEITAQISAILAGIQAGTED